jgi:diacylglycerol kinase
MNTQAVPQESPPPEKSGGIAHEARGLARSFVYAFEGVRHTVRTQRNMRIHIAIAVLAIAGGLFFRVSPVEFALIFVAIMNVVISEMFNTVAEACVDLATKEVSPLAKIAKDVAAGAVFLNACLSIVIGLFVFGPHLLVLARHIVTHR